MTGSEEGTASETPNAEFRKLSPLPEFRPAFWLRGRHGQTILPSLLPARPIRGRAETLDVPVAPGSAVRVLLHKPAHPIGTLVLLHGLGGSAESGYMRRTGALALARGWAVARVNLRTCGGTEALASTLYNAGQSDDAGAVLAALDRRGLPRPYGLVGFSLGGNIALKYAGMAGGSCLADAIVGVNPPVDLAACIAALERPSNRLYHAYFTRKLWTQLKRLRRVRDVPGPRRIPRGVRGFDDAFTAPDAGYASAADYYAGASAGPRLAAVARPALVLSSDDDPFVPVGAFEPFRAGARRVVFAHPRGGGHCGYWRAARPRYWAGEAALSFMDDVLTRGA
ncbi:MAG TPA: alpha/beta fold hydrolase [Candidatus Polarisedimenticolaceae bacterium]|nr:alpha/beta fold hydrolase [Candidatus Polarisedimenticolaceae bacterium]